MIPAHLQNFISAFNHVAQLAHNNAVAKGFWDNPEDDLAKICKMHEELSEACSAVRHGNPPDDKIPEFSGVEAELADCIVRIMDFAAGRNLRVSEALISKMEFNKSRPRLHGKLS
jgi:NTP pyrophosphatase (non-canonical NTP hydrolase)